MIPISPCISPKHVYNDCITKGNIMTTPSAQRVKAFETRQKAKGLTCRRYWATVDEHVFLRDQLEQLRERMKRAYEAGK